MYGWGDQPAISPTMTGEETLFIHFLPQRGVAVSETAAEHGDAVFGILEVRLHYVVERHNDPAARFPQRMAQRQGAAPDIDVVERCVLGNSQLTKTGQPLASKSLV